MSKATIKSDPFVNRNPIHKETTTMASTMQSGVKKIKPPKESRPAGDIDGDDDGEVKKGRKRQPHPLVNSKNKDAYPFAALPPDFDFKTHAPLKKRDFKDEAAFCGYKATVADAVAAYWRKRGEESAALGGTKERAAARRLLRMQEKIAELRKSLESDGMDVDAFLAKLGVKS